MRTAPARGSSPPATRGPGEASASGLALRRPPRRRSAPPPASAPFCASPRTHLLEEALAHFHAQAVVQHGSQQLAIILQRREVVPLRRPGTRRGRGPKKGFDGRLFSCRFCTSTPSPRRPASRRGAPGNRRTSASAAPAHPHALEIIGRVRHGCGRPLRLLPPTRPLLTLLDCPRLPKKRREEERCHRVRLAGQKRMLVQSGGCAWRQW